MARDWTDQQKKEHADKLRKGYYLKYLKKNDVPHSEEMSIEELTKLADDFKAGKLDGATLVQAGRPLDEQRQERLERELELMRRQMRVMIEAQSTQKGGVPIDLLDPDDTLEEPVVLWTNVPAKSLSFKVVNGRFVYPPGGRSYRFQGASNIPVKDHHGVVVGLKFTSFLILETKTDRDWVLGNPAKGETPHQDYGLFFWRNATDAMSVETRDIEMLQRQITYLRTLSETEILRLCEEQGVPIRSGNSAQEYVFPLAKRMTEAAALTTREAHNMELERRAREMTASAVQ